LCFYFIPKGDRIMQGTKDKIERFGQNAGKNAEKAAETVKDTASGAFGAVKETFQDVTGAAADMASKAAGQVRDNAKEFFGSAEDFAANAARNVQDAASGAAGKLGDWGGDVAGIIRRNPIPAIFVAIGIGYLTALACRSDRS